MSKSIITLIAAATIGLSGWQQTIASEYYHEQGEQGEQEHNMHLLGAWSKIPVDEAVMDAAAFATDMIDDGQLLTVLSAKRQVVAGINYSLVLSMDSGHVWEVIVYQNLNNVDILISKNQIDQNGVEPYL
ncbi:MAG: hypothetical protein KAG53_08780 [Endozoicomonadaceae bacterium]|nr:hypothetical protein [Endozoicomonadaceae bacterium]